MLRLNQHTCTCALQSHLGASRVFFFAASVSPYPSGGWRWIGSVGSDSSSHSLLRPGKGTRENRSPLRCGFLVPPRRLELLRVATKLPATASIRPLVHLHVMLFSNIIKHHSRQLLAARARVGVPQGNNNDGDDTNHNTNSEDNKLANTT